MISTINAAMSANDSRQGIVGVDLPYVAYASWDDALSSYTATVSKIRRNEAMAGCAFRMRRSNGHWCLPLSERYRSPPTDMVFDSGQPANKNGGLSRFR